MKQILSVTGLLMGLLFTTGLGVFSFFGIYNMGQYAVYSGQIDKTAGEEIVLLTDEGEEPLRLSFAFDKESDLVIEEFNSVNVSGYYNKILKVLKVEEIYEQTNPPILCLQEMNN